MFVYVHETVSPGSRSMFAVCPETVVPLSSSVQARLVKSQPAGGADSVTVYDPAERLVKDWLPLPPEVAIENGLEIPRPRVAERPVAADRDLVDHDVGRREDRPDMIWLSRFPTEAPSAAVMRMWHGPPEIEPAPTPAPQPRGPMLGARCPPKRSMTFAPSAVDGTEYVSVMRAYSSPDPAGSSCVYAERAGELPTVEREDLAAELVPGGGAARPH